MSSIDVEALLTAISEESPCGEDLEYDAEFMEMGRAAEARAASQFEEEGEPADWKSVRKLALSLLSRTKDMRVIVLLGRAELHESGLPEFADCLAVLRGYVEQYWETVFPPLDEDDGDPTFRMNTLIDLGGETLTLLRQAPLVKSRALGWFGLREVERAKEAVEAPPKADDGYDDDAAPEQAKGPDKATIDAAFQDGDPEELQLTADAIGQAIEHVDAIETSVTSMVGAGNAVSLSPIREMLVDMQSIMTEQLQRRGIGVPEEEEGGEESGDGEAGGGTGGGGGGATQRLTGDITCREDAIRALDKVCDFYDRHEPSSPLPLLIRRAQRLATKSFLDIIRDLAPDGVSQAEAIGGVVPESTEESW